MIFLLDSAFSLELLAFAGGVALWLWASRVEAGRALGRAAGLFVMVAALLTMACTLYYGWSYRQAGHFEVKAAAQGMQGMHGMGQGGGMMKCPMMEQMKEKMGPESGPSEKGPGGADHNAHH